MNQLDALRQWTTVVADTGDFRQLAQFKPQDATTNPSLILKAVQKADYRPLLDEVVTKHRGAPVDEVIDRLLVRFGTEILSIIPGRVSTEVDARLSFDTQATIDRAERIVALYRAEGIDVSKRLLIKVASTWEGIEAARQLEQKGIHCNLTLLFSFCQAVACGDGGITLISPFVGRITDWHKKQAGAAWDDAARAGANDPGVQSVTRIFDYYKHFDIRTEVMGASFRNVGEITELAGCDLLTISPSLLAQLDSTQGELPRKLDPEAAQNMEIQRIPMDRATFDKMHAADRMASDKLSEGIAGFSKALENLETMLAHRITELEESAVPAMA